MGDAASSHLRLGLGPLPVHSLKNLKGRQLETRDTDHKERVPTTYTPRFPKPPLPFFSPLLQLVFFFLPQTNTLLSITLNLVARVMLLHTDPSASAGRLPGVEPLRPRGMTFSAQRFDPLRSIPPGSSWPPLPLTPPSPLPSRPRSLTGPSSFAAPCAAGDGAEDAKSRGVATISTTSGKADDETSMSEVKLEVLDFLPAPAFVVCMLLLSDSGAY